MSLELSVKLNGDCHSAIVDRAALDRAMQAQGAAWHNLVTARCPHLFAAAPVFITAAQMQQMREVIDAVERVVKLPGWMNAPTGTHLPPHRGKEGMGVAPLSNADTSTPTLTLPLHGGGNAIESGCMGVFYGYDFHLNADGAHLIEINSNAGGGFLNALLLDSQHGTQWPGNPPVSASTGSARTEEHLEKVFLEMFRNEWRLARGDEPLERVAIVDEQPESQYLYPEFLLAQRMFERAGIAAYVADPAVFHSRGDHLYLDGQKIDLVYNRLTDFSLERHPVLRQAYLNDSAVVTPSPAHHARYADKRNLARLTDADRLRASGVNEADVAVLQAGIPLTIAVLPEMEEMLWSDRKLWFFKPNSGYGSKGAYRGEKLTKRVFAEILQGDYVAQKLAPPGERSLCMNDEAAVSLKYDVRCYVYDGRIQLVAARLYQGQTTNFRTLGGGFAPIRVVE